MKFDYTITLDDFKNFQIYNFFYRNEKKVVKSFKITLVISPIIMMGIVSIFTKDFKYVTIAMLACSVLPFVIPKSSITGWYKAKIEKIINKEEYPGYPCVCSIEINDRCISVTTENSKSEVNWNGITDVHITQNYFYLYTTSTTALIIPKNSISTKNPDDVERELFKIERILKGDKVNQVFPVTY
jgi:hypothetical protein